MFCNSHRSVLFSVILTNLYKAKKKTSERYVEALNRTARIRH